MQYAYLFYYSLFQVEALDLFEEIRNSIFFSESSILTRETKIKVKNIRDIDVFSDYNNYEGIITTTMGFSTL